MLSPGTLGDFQRAIAEIGAEGWLLYDFRGTNPVAAELLGIRGMVTRRYFVFIPREGEPQAITHAIEQGQWAAWPSHWPKHVYSSWRVLEETLGRVVSGKRVAMEYSPGDAVPYVDRVPAGVVEMIRSAGAEVVTSGELVTRLYAVWTPDNVASHQRAAERIRGIARQAFDFAATRARSLRPAHEHDVKHWILDQFSRWGMETDHGPNVSVGENAANPHYEPSDAGSRIIQEGDILLIDLWARETEGGVYADQTWMGSIGDPPPRAVKIWEAVRDARDAAIDIVRERAASGVPMRGAEVDRAAREVIESRGFGKYFIHRTGHSIDARDLHGSGPHLDDLETREERLLIPGVGFSIEPGIYIPGEIGVRSEVNAYLEEGRAVITPAEYQRELIVV
jgi:Xaa-Pro dipeptidase